MPTPPRQLTFRDVTKPIAEWAAEFRVPLGTLRSRLNLGWTVERALTTPVDQRFSSSNAGAVPLGTPRPVPKMRRRKDGLAFVRWQNKGRRHWITLGKWGSAEAREAYRRFTLEWSEGMTAAKEIDGYCTVAELAELYLDHADRYYRKRGKRTAEYHACVRGMGFMCDAAGMKLVVELTADDLRLMMRAMVDAGRARKTCNSYRGCILRCLKWGATQIGGNGKPLVLPAIYHAIAAVEPLQKNRTNAPDGKPIRAVAWADVEATFKYLHTHEPRRAALEAMIRFHWLTGMRSQDVTSMRPRDIDRTFAEWCYRPESHKQDHKEGDLEYYLGPKARAIIEPILATCPPDRPVFALPPRTAKGGSWWVIDTGAYGKLIRRACQRKGGTRWHPHQLRHSRATEVQRIYESDAAAAAAIGDTPEVTRRIYVDPNAAVKRRIARETG